MATRGQGYTSTYLRGRREMLESAVAQATATIESDRAKYDAERSLYNTAITTLDGQILEYDKLLAKAVSDREKLLRPRTTRVTTGGQSEKVSYGAIAGGVAALSKPLSDAMDARDMELKMPAVFAGQLSETAAKLTAATDLSTQQALAGNLADEVFTSDLFHALDPGAKADTVRQINNSLQALVPSFDLFKKGPDGRDNIPLTEEERKYLNPDEYDKLVTTVEERLEIPAIREARAKGLETAVGEKGTFYGGGTYSRTSQELAPGEAERMKRIKSPQFQAVAKALRDDGVLSDAERAALEKAEINPDAYLDDALMQAVARTGLLMARRGELVGRQEQARADLAALVAPDTSEQRRRELTSMQYGPAGITPTQALLAPRRVEERMGEERERLSVKQAMIEGVMRAAAGDEFDLTEDENVYASQLAESVLGGNTAGVKQTYNQMREAGYDDDRIRSGFAVASRRAKDLAARREAQAQAAVTTE